MSQNKNRCSFTFKWDIDSKILKDVENGKCFKSKTFTLPGAAFKGVQYYFSLYPNGKEADQKGWLWIYFNIGMRYKKEIQADLTLVSLRNEKATFSFIYNDNGYNNHGIKFAIHEALLEDPTNFFINDKLALKCDIVISVLNNKKEMQNASNLLSQKLFKSDEKDLKIAVKDQEIMVHKCILSSFSPIFKAMIKTAANELQTIIEIPDFEYDTVKTVMDYCYGVKNLNNEPVNSLLALLKFATKYAILDLKVEVQYCLMYIINVSNVCEISNCAIENSAKLLQKQCHDHLKSLLSNKKFIPNIENLNTKMMKEVLSHIGIPNGYLQIGKVNDNRDSMELQQNIALAEDTDGKTNEDDDSLFGFLKIVVIAFLGSIFGFGIICFLGIFYICFIYYLDQLFR